MQHHTEKIHLFIIDWSLTDYHHEHPRPMRMAGKFSFPFTPRKPGAYLVWADLRPEPMGLQEFVSTTIPATSESEPLADTTPTNRVTFDGLTYEVLFRDHDLQTGKSISGRLRITDRTGQPFTQLEPVMDSFAHLVGFYGDRKSVLHIHPSGPPVLSASARGGPELAFQFYPLQAGLIRLFVQVQIAGAPKIIPFAIQITR